MASKSEIYAKLQHASVNQTYAGRDYALHLDLCHYFFDKFRNIIVENLSDVECDLAEDVLWLHDTIEDTFVTYNTLKNVFNLHVAEEVFTLTEEKGRDRHERHNHKYLTGVGSSSISAFVKLMDIIANVSYSIHSKNKMYFRYKQEFPNVRRYLQYNNPYLSGICQYIQEVIDSNCIEDCVASKISELEEKYPVLTRISITCTYQDELNIYQEAEKIRFNENLVLINFNNV